MKNLNPRDVETLYQVKAIDSSDDLAAVLNARPLTTEDAAETPRDWLDGIWVGGTVYPLSPQESTDTLAVLADGTAAVRRTQAGEYCGYPRHNHHEAHWCPADTDAADWDGARGVERDWRKVYVWDLNGYADTTVYPALGVARAAFDREKAEIDKMDAEMTGDEGEQDRC